MQDKVFFMWRLVVEEIISHIRCINMDEELVIRFEKYLKEASQIFICGFGESELIGKAFASRLQGLHQDVFVITDTIVPAMNNKDVMVAISGSGDTEPTLTLTKRAHEIGASILSITSFSDSPLANVSDLVIEIPGRIKPKTKDYIERRVSGEYEPLTPFGALFEISTRIFLEGVVVELANDGANY